MLDVKHLTAEELEAGMEEILGSPKDAGAVEMIVRRPRPDEREVLEEARLDAVEGLVGDCWKTRRDPRDPDEPPDPESQITVMNSRLIQLLAQDRKRWPLAGDQLYVDLDLGVENLPPGTRLAIGEAVIEVTSPPHTGCGKFKSRYGREATMFVNSAAGKRLRLRGLNAKIVKGGAVRVGDVARKI
jgi:MOSC domain-containing protein YiiM